MKKGCPYEVIINFQDSPFFCCFHCRPDFTGRVLASQNAPRTLLQVFAMWVLQRKLIHISDSQAAGAAGRINFLTEHDAKRRMVRTIKYFADIFGNKVASGAATAENAERPCAKGKHNQILCCLAYFFL